MELSLGEADEELLMNRLKADLEAAIVKVRTFQSQSRKGSIFQDPSFAGKVFVRLSSRSPKDAVDKIPGKRPALVRQIRAELDIESATRRCSISSLDETIQMNALRRAFFKCSAISSADEALELIMHSARTISDLKRSLDHIDIIPWNVKFIVREFVLIPTEGEFRGFVHNGELNAVSQYFADSYFPKLVETKGEIVRLISACYERFRREVLPKLKFNSFIIDFAIAGNEVQVVELNPFSRTTGACLFDWIKDKDVIENGPLELRVVEKALDSARGHLTPWLPLIKEALNLPSTSSSYSSTSFLLFGAAVLTLAVAITFLRSNS